MADNPPRWQPFHSVPTRIILFVLAVTLATSLVVTWVSVGRIHAFLNTRIEQKFPTILRGAVERLDLWYAQRTLDVQTFARRDLLVESLERLRSGAGGSRARAATSEVRSYLEIVLEGFPQYDALFLLDPGGGVILNVGVDPKLPSSLRTRLARVSSARVSDAYRLGPRPFQIASAPIEGASGRKLGSLHAIVPLESLEELLRSEGLGGSGQMLVVGSDRTVLIPTAEGSEPNTFGRDLPQPGAAPGVEQYTNEAGFGVVGSAAHFPRFRWTVAVEEDYDEAFKPIYAVVRRVLAIDLGVVLLVALVAYRITRSIVSPIEALSEGARRILKGEHDVVIPTPWRKDEIALLTRTFNDMVAKLNANRIELQLSRVEIEAANERLRFQNQELQRANEALSQLSITDGLTKLHNHRFFQDHLSREIKRARRAKDPLSLILIDIDNFKTLNDRHGHAGGDAVLRRIAEVMNALTRETDLLARYGGEEFALLASQTDLDGAMALAEKIRMGVSETKFVITEGRPKMRVTVSIGVSTYRGDRTRFFNDADDALYEAKGAGKDCVIVASDEK
jgi:diguanylate cyclase (GGDEF)-like protein